MRIEIGKVTEAEKDAIQALYERKNGLEELAKILPADNHELYERIVHDMSESKLKFHAWWTTMAEKYGWTGDVNTNWQIDFQTCKIYLNKD